MKYHKQLFKHNPDEGIYGDCFRTCIACLLDLEPQEVPHFAEYISDDEEESVFMDRARLWLKDRGLGIASFAYDFGPDKALYWMSKMNPGIHYIMVGEGKGGANHCVVCLDDAVIHDPHYDEKGLIGPCDDNLTWIDILVKL